MTIPSPSNGDGCYFFFSFYLFSPMCPCVLFTGCFMLHILPSIEVDERSALSERNKFHRRRVISHYRLFLFIYLSRRDDPQPIISYCVKGKMFNFLNGDPNFG